MRRHAIVQPAGIQDRDGGVQLDAALSWRDLFLKKLVAGGGHRGSDIS